MLNALAASSHPLTAILCNHLQLLCFQLIYFVNKIIFKIPAMLSLILSGLMNFSITIFWPVKTLQPIAFLWQKSIVMLCKTRRTRCVETLNVQPKQLSVKRTYIRWASWAYQPFMLTERKLKQGKDSKINFIHYSITYLWTAVFNIFRKACHCHQSI